MDRVMDDMRAVNGVLRIVPPKTSPAIPVPEFLLDRGGRMRADGKYLFHEDALNARTLCCYNTPTTEGLAPGAARSFAELDGLRDTGAATGFFFPARGARPFSFRPGDLFRFAGKYNREGAASFIHRAPRIPQGNAPRLLLMGR